MSSKNILKIPWLLGLLLVQCQPASTQVPPFRELARMFDYDQRAPLDVKEHSVEEREGAKVYDITYASPQGGRVTAYLVAPASKGRHAGIIFAHPGGGDRTVFLPEALMLARAGAVSLLIDDPSARPAVWRRRMFTHTEPENDRAAYIQAIIDLRRGVDLLAARPDVDAKRLGFAGFSFGADLGGILSGVERRIKAYALMGTGARLTDLWRSGDTPQLARLRASLTKEQLDKYIETTSCFDSIHYIGHAAPSAILFQFGRRDRNWPEKLALEFYQAGSEPKEIKWWDGGHELNDEAMRHRAEWFQSQIGIAAIRPARRWM
jgi:cephalosporin-C deacetylase-like acetyl esterase